MAQRPNAGEQLLDLLTRAFSADGQWTADERAAMREATAYVTRANLCASVLRTGVVPRDDLADRAAPTAIRDMARRLGQRVRDDLPPAA